jgi:hypothetical protein
MRGIVFDLDGHVHPAWVARFAFWHSLSGRLLACWFVVYLHLRSILSIEDVPRAWLRPPQRAAG